MAAYENEDTKEVAAPADERAGNDAEYKEPDQATKSFVEKWTAKICAAEDHHKDAFDDMRECMHIAKTGGSKAWTGEKDQIEGNYVVPILARHIDQSVAQLYAKNPKAWAQRKKRRMHQVWDGRMESLMEAQASMAAGGQMGIIDPNAMAILADAEQVKQYIIMIDGLADTMMILHEYYMNEQSAGYKQQYKSLVRRVKTCGVGYVVLDFQRVLEQNPDVTARIEDVTTQIDTMNRLIAEQQREAFDEESGKFEELRRVLEDLQAQQHLIVREGPVFGFPRATSIIIDPECYHLKTLAGARWWAQRFDMSPERIEEIWKKNIRGKFKEYRSEAGKRPKWAERKALKETSAMARVYKVQDKQTRLEFTICDGYCDYLEAPAAPNVKIERFFTLFPLLFNEVEDEDDLFPKSDIWRARHGQFEYNRARQGLRDHRKANKPGWYSPTGALGKDDMEKLQNRSVNDILEVDGLLEGQRLDDKLKELPTITIDPALYEVEHLFNDTLRTVGSQSANLGQTKGDTATESSIAEQSRQIAESSSVDDLDDHLSEVAKATGQLMLAELSKETVMEIVGPGAVWPDMPQSREEIAKDLSLDIRAGSSGRPNKAADLANLERGMPFLIQLPGMNSTPLARRYSDLLGIDADEAIVEGLPSIVAQNAMASKPSPQPGTGDPGSDPGAQGPEGGDNAPAAAENEPQSQPAYPAPETMQPNVGGLPA